MLTTQSSPMQSVPATTTGTPQPGNAALMQFRKAIGVPENQPAPEDKVIAACMGNMGPDVKRMAAAIVGQRNMPPDSGMENRSVEPPTSPDPGQAGGQDAPPNPNGPSTSDAAAIQPGEATGGKMGAATIFGKRPTPGIGAQPAGAGGPEDDDEDDQMPGAKSVFSKGR